MQSSFEDRLNARIAASRERQARAQKDLATLFQRAEQMQEAQIRAWQAAVPPGAGEALRLNRFTPPSVAAQVSLGGAGLLQQLDALMWQAFALDSRFPGAPLGKYPVIYCETLEEFFTQLVLDADASESAKQEYIAGMIAEAEAQARASGGGTLGVNLPGRGCYVNGWLFGLAHGGAAQAALQNPKVLPHIVATVCHEKLGHGFIADLTAIGQEKTNMGLWRFDLARRFALRAVDTPQSALLRAKDTQVYHATKFTEEGWATWIEHIMVWLAARQGLLPSNGAPGPLQPKYSLAAVAQVLEYLRQGTPPRSDERQFMELVAALTQILTDDKNEYTEADVFTAVRAWQQLAPAFDEVFSQVFGQPTLYVLGYLLLRRLEARLGWQNLPYAVALAGNVTYDLETISLNDLATLLQSDPRLNVDARLALLGTLQLQPGQGPADLARLARERLGYATPQGWG